MLVQVGATKTASGIKKKKIIHNTYDPDLKMTLHHRIHEGKTEAL